MKCQCRTSRAFGGGRSSGSGINDTLLSSPSGVPGVNSPPEQARDDGQRRIDECLAAIRSASEGARHPTYTRKAARAKAICDKHDINWGPVRASLIEAYESTLTATEARQRRKSSIEGVVTWLEARSAR
jgi:hypothetical protein